MNKTLKEISESPSMVTAVPTDNLTIQSPWLSEKILDFINVYCIPLILLAGSIGNISSVLVIFKTKLRKLSSNYYLAALSVSDTCFLFQTSCHWMHLPIINQNIFCQFFTYVTYLSSFLSAWFVVSFTLERFIAVLYPLKRKTMCTVRRAKMVLCALTVAGGLINIPILLYSNVIYLDEANFTICDMGEHKYQIQMQTFNYVDTVLVLIVPLTFIIVLNTCTVFTVWREARVRQTMVTHTSKTSNMSDNELQPPIRQKIADSSEMKVTQMLVITSSVFVCLNSPSYIMRSIRNLQTEESKVTVVLQEYCDLLFITNFGINFI